MSTHFKFVQTSAMRVVVGEGNTPYPGDYRSRDQMIAEARGSAGHGGAGLR